MAPNAATIAPAPDFALPPLELLAGSVRNGREAAALVDIDTLALKHEVIHDHLLASCAHERELERLQRALADGGTADPQLLAAAPLILILSRIVVASAPRHRFFFFLLKIHSP